MVHLTTRGELSLWKQRRKKKNFNDKFSLPIFANLRNFFLPFYNFRFLFRQLGCHKHVILHETDSSQCHINCTMCNSFGKTSPCSLELRIVIEISATTFYFLNTAFKRCLFAPMHSILHAIVFITQIFNIALLSCHNCLSLQAPFKLWNSSSKQEFKGLDTQFLNAMSFFFVKDCSKSLEYSFLPGCRSYWPKTKQMTILSAKLSGFEWIIWSTQLSFKLAWNLVL